MKNPLKSVDSLVYDREVSSDDIHCWMGSGEEVSGAVSDHSHWKLSSLRLSQVSVLWASRGASTEWSGTWALSVTTHHWSPRPRLAPTQLHAVIHVTQTLHSSPLSHQRLVQSVGTCNNTAFHSTFSNHTFLQHTQPTLQYSQVNSVEKFLGNVPTTLLSVRNQLIKKCINI